MHYYTAYGLSIASEQSIPGLTSLSECLPADADIVVCLGQFPDWFDERTVRQRTPVFSSSGLDTDGTPLQRIWETPSGHLLVHFSDGLAFLVDRAGREIWGRWNDGLPFDAAAQFLRGPMMSFVLGLHGYVCLHASAVVVDGRALVFTGPPGAGKSTTALAFARGGFQALTDDIVAFSQNGHGFKVLPGYPRLSVWPVSAVIGPSAESMPRVIPGEEKRYVNLDVDGAYHPHATALGAVYVLEPRAAASCELATEALAGAEGVVRLLANNCGSERLSREHRAREFEVLSQVLRQVPVRRLYVPRDPGRLDDLRLLLLRDFRSSVQPA